MTLFVLHVLDTFQDYDRPLGCGCPEAFTLHQVDASWPFLTVGTGGDCGGGDRSCPSSGGSALVSGSEGLDHSSLETACALGICFLLGFADPSRLKAAYTDVR